jgi:hypothetical protein
MVGEYLHDVRQDWRAAELLHVLGPVIGLFGQAVTQAAGKIDHVYYPDLITARTWTPRYHR